MIDFFAAIFEFIASFSPDRVAMALIPTFIAAIFAYWIIPDKTIGAWTSGIIIIAGIIIGIWWHFRKTKWNGSA